MCLSTSHTWLWRVPTLLGRIPKWPRRVPTLLGRIPKWLGGFLNMLEDS